MRKISKLVTMLLIIGSFLSINNFVYAEGNNSDQQQMFTPERYKELQEQGILGEDVNYELAKTLFDVPEELNSVEDFDKLAEVGILEKVEVDSSMMHGTPYSSYRAGDIFVSSKPGGGMVSWVHGHAGIVGSDGQMIHMIQSGVKKESVSNFLKHNQGTSAYRVPNSTVSNNAAKWASNYYNNWRGKAQYSINTEKYTQNKMYCSKLVWQSYWFGTGSAPVLKNPTWVILHPYGLTGQFNSAYKPQSI